jgi:hypothetical protein
MSGGYTEVTEWVNVEITLGYTEEQFLGCLAFFVELSVPECMCISPKYDGVDGIHSSDDVPEYETEFKHSKAKQTRGQEQHKEQPASVNGIHAGNRDFECCYSLLLNVITRLPACSIL